MATITNYGYRTAGASITSKAKPLPADPSCQPCPDCGGLQCLCRPRFFAGQLLSEQDLNRLDHYITEKHKLHNRHLHGAGVVCGLEVKCAPCDSEFVTVTSGYALSPCGEDIVVCKADTVNICELINRCRTDEEPDCAPYRGQDNCGDVIEDWILSVRYAESPSRGITPLTGAGQGCGCSCGSGCSGNCGGNCRGSGGGCGGGGGCSCGAAEGRAEPQPLAQPRLKRGAPPSCEPTQICETYRYDVFRAPLDKVREGGDDNQSGLSGIFAQLEGEMMARIACCIKQLEDALPPAPGDAANIPVNQQMAWFQWGCQMRTALANYFVRTGTHNCEAIARLQAIVVPSPNANDAAAFQGAMQIAVVQFILLVFEAMVACICSNALPPCPSADDPRVPLALVRVRRKPCKIVSVCNWHPLRKHVLTFPTMGYWFGFIPIARILRDVMHKICCDLFGLRDMVPEPERPQTGVVVVGGGAPPPPPPPPQAVAAQPATATAAQPATTAFSFDQAISIDPLSGIKFDTSIFELMAKRFESSGGSLSWNNLGKATLSRETVRVDAGLRGDDRVNEVDRVAQAGPFAILAGLMAGAPEIGMAAAVAAAPAAAATGIADMEMLKAMVANQAKEIDALKVAVGRPAATPKSPRGKGK